MLLKCFKAIVCGAFVCAEKKEEGAKPFSILLSGLSNRAQRLSTEQRRCRLPSPGASVSIGAELLCVYWPSLTAQERFVLLCLRESQE